MFFELQFLPHHNEAITWWQRVTVGADLVLLWQLWPSIALLNTPASASDAEPAPISKRWTPGTMWVLRALSAFLMLFIATFPGEHLDILLRWGAGQPHSKLLYWFRVRLVEGVPNPITRKPDSLWSNRLILSGFDVIDHTKLDTEAKIAAQPVTALLRGRDLQGAVLIGAVLRNVDLFHADLRNAKLDYADLRGAKFFGDAAKGDGAAKGGDAAKVGHGRIEGWKFEAPETCANFQGASLNSAQLQGASLDFAQFQSASLSGAKLQGASLNFAQLQGASLNSAQLQGASLYNAQLQGASLNNAQLQGASLERAQLQGASVRWAFVWRADLRLAETSVAWIDSVHSVPTLRCNESGTNFICPWTETTLRDLKEEIGRVVPEGRYREAGLTRLARLLHLPPAAPESQEAAIDSWWNNTDIRLQRPTREDFEAEAAKHWRQVGCQPDGAPHIVRQLASRLTNPFSTPFGNDSPHPAALATAFLAKDCAGAVGLSDALRAQLQRLNPPKPPPLDPAAGSRRLDRTGENRP